MNGVYKPGFKTTEFYTMILSVIISGFVMSGKVDANTGNQLTNAIVTFIGALYGLYTVVVYMKGRFDLKKTIINSQTQALPTASVDGSQITP